MESILPLHSLRFYCINNGTCRTESPSFLCYGYFFESCICCNKLCCLEIVVLIPNLSIIIIGTSCQGRSGQVMYQAWKN
jgi:hypothetical protein